MARSIIAFTFTDEHAGVREALFPDGRGEGVCYNVGKVSSLMSDPETVRLHLKPVQKYTSLAEKCRSCDYRRTCTAGKAGAP